MLTSIAYYILAPILLLSVIVFIHELGHFLAARYYGVQVYTFSVGFGREMAGFTDRHGTRWKFSIFPFGGYVSHDQSEHYPLQHRAIIALGGPVANILSTFLIMVVVALTFGIPRPSPVIVGVNIHAGAFEAGLLPGDKVLSINGDDIPYEMDALKNLIKKFPNDFMEIQIVRDKKFLDYRIPIQKLKETDDFGNVVHRPMLGISFAGYNLKLSAINKVGSVVTENNQALAREELIKAFDKNIVINFGKGDDREDFLIHVGSQLNQGLLDKNHRRFKTLMLWEDREINFVHTNIKTAISESSLLVYEACKRTLGVLYQIIVGRKSADDLNGVVGISSMTGEIFEESSHKTNGGAYYIIRLIAVLSVAIGFVNLFPLPLLDGGHLALHGYEAIMRKPPSLKVKGYFYGIGAVSMLILMIVVGYRDIIERSNS